MSDAWFPPLAVHDTTWFQPLQILTNITFPFLIDLMSNFHSLLQWNLYKSLPLIPEMRIKKLSLDEDYFLVRIFFFSNSLQSFWNVSTTATFNFGEKNQNDMTSIWWIIWKMS